MTQPGSAVDPAGYLSIRGLVKDFDGYKAVNNISLDIAKGEIFALLGSSGCGKSTLLRMLAGFETPTSGSIVLNGRDLSTMPPYERPMNMMFQSYALFPHLTVWDNIAFGLRRSKMARDDIAAQVEAMLKLVQLGKFAQRKPHQLSGGQQQRVALARSLAKKPQLLLLDEPLGALDKKLREETQIELVNIIENVGVTCVMVTHDQEEAMTMASRLAVMSEGRFLQVGAPGDQVDHVIIDCADCQHYVGHGITGTEGMAVTVALRPEKIRIGRELLPPQDGEPEGGLNRVQGTVKDLSYFGSFTVYHLTLASGMVLKISASNTERHRADSLTWGDVAWASWSPDAHVVLTA